VVRVLKIQPSARSEYDNVVELESFLAQIPANKLVNYLPSQFVGDDVYTWIKQGFLAGTLQDSKLFNTSCTDSSSGARFKNSTKRSL
jgi:hypothetical protein